MATAVVALWVVAQMATAQTDTITSAINQADTLTQQQRIELLEQQLATLQEETSKTKKDLAIDHKWSRKKFLNLSYGKQEIKPDYGGKFESDISLDLMKGWDIYVHRRPIGGVLMMGFDLGAYISGTKYKVEKGMFAINNPFSDSRQNREDEEPDFYQMDTGGFVGPALTVNPIGQLKLKAYWYFMPAYSVQFTKAGDNIDASTAFAPFTKYGVELAYGLFGIGVEVKAGKAKYKSAITIDGEDNNIKTQFDTSSTKLYVTLKI